MNFDFVSITKTSNGRVFPNLNFTWSPSQEPTDLGLDEQSQHGIFSSPSTLSSLISSCSHLSVSKMESVTRSACLRVWPYSPWHCRTDCGVRQACPTERHAPKWPLRVKWLVYLRKWHVNLGGMWCHIKLLRQWGTARTSLDWHKT